MQVFRISASFFRVQQRRHVVCRYVCCMIIMENVVKPYIALVCYLPGRRHADRKLDQGCFTRASSWYKAPLKNRSFTKNKHVKSKQHVVSGTYEPNQLMGRKTVANVPPRPAQAPPCCSRVGRHGRLSEHHQQWCTVGDAVGNPLLFLGLQSWDLPAVARESGGTSW